MIREAKPRDKLKMKNKTESKGCTKRTKHNQ